MVLFLSVFDKKYASISKRMLTWEGPLNYDAMHGLPRPWLRPEQSGGFLELMNNGKEKKTSIGVE